MIAARNPLVAATLSAVFFPGLGQVYCGATGRGLVVLAATVGVVVGVALLDGRLFMLGLLMAMAAGAVDAYRLAARTAAPT